MAGLTFGQLVSVLMLLGAIIGVYVRAKVEIAKLEVRVTEIEKDITSNKDDSRDDIQKLTKSFKDYQKENKDEHKELFRKIDDIKTEIINILKT